MPRCFWCNDDPLYQAYHDEEWGVPQRDPQVLFELLLLEGFQAGLSWITVLKKREHYRKVLFGFDVQRLAQMSDAEIEQLMLDPGIIRNRLKLNAARRNAKAWLELHGVAVEPVRVDEYTGRRFTFFSDPDGLPLELYEVVPSTT